MISKWWLRVVGLFYVVIFVVVVFVKAPIRVEGPAGALDRAAAGDSMARFVVDTWVTLGLELGAIGAALLVASRIPEQAKALIGAVVGMEVAGIVADIYKLARGYDPTAPVTWMFIHSAIIATGLLALRTSRSRA